MPERKPEQIFLSQYANETFPYQRKPTFPEVHGARLALIALVVICGISVGLFIAWIVTMPSIGELQALGLIANGDTSSEIIRSIRAAHTSTFGELFKNIVLAGLVPLFTLLAGYAFGTSRRASSDSAE